MPFRLGMLRSPASDRDVGHLYELPSRLATAHKQSEPSQERSPALVGLTKARKILPGAAVAADPDGSHLAVRPVRTHALPPPASRTQSRLLSRLPGVPEESADQCLS